MVKKSIPVTNKNDDKKEKPIKGLMLPTPPHGIWYGIKRMFGLATAEDTEYKLRVVSECLQFILDGHFQMISHLDEESKQSNKTFLDISKVLENFESKIHTLEEEVNDLKPARQNQRKSR